MPGSDPSEAQARFVLARPNGFRGRARDQRSRRIIRRSSNSPACRPGPSSRSLPATTRGGSSRSVSTALLPRKWSRSATRYGASTKRGRVRSSRAGQARRDCPECGVDHPWEVNPHAPGSGGGRGHGIRCSHSRSSQRGASPFEGSRFGRPGGVHHPRWPGRLRPSAGPSPAANQERPGAAQPRDRATHPCRYALFESRLLAVARPRRRDRDLRGATGWTPVLSHRRSSSPFRAGSGALTSRSRTGWPLLRRAASLPAFAVLAARSPDHEAAKRLRFKSPVPPHPEPGAGGSRLPARCRRRTIGTRWRGAILGRLVPSALPGMGGARGGGATRRA